MSVILFDGNCPAATQQRDGGGDGIDAEAEVSVPKLPLAFILAIFAQKSVLEHSTRSLYFLLASLLRSSNQSLQQPRLLKPAPRMVQRAGQLSRHPAMFHASGGRESRAKQCHGRQPGRRERWPGSRAETVPRSAAVSCCW